MKKYKPKKAGTMRYLLQGIPADTWKAFMIRCRQHDMTGQLVLQKMVEAYSRGLIDIEP